MRPYKCTVVFEIIYFLQDLRTRIQKTEPARCLGYTNKVHLRGLKSLQAAEAAFVPVATPF
jgi:hypothetical protein